MSVSNFPERIPKLGGSHSITYFWRYKPEFYRLVGSRCEKCGSTYFPRRMICPKCHSTELRDTELKREGTIISIQMGRGTLMGFEDTRPQFFCIVKLDDGAYIQGELIGLPLGYAKQELLKPSGTMAKELCGRRVKVAIRRLRRLDNGYPIYGYKFMLSEPGDLLPRR